MSAIRSSQSASPARPASCLQFLDDPCTDLFVRKADGVDSDVCVLPVQREAFREQVVQVLVRSFCESSCSVVRHSRSQRRHIHVQEHNDAVRLYMRHGRGAVHGAAAGGDNMIVAIELKKDILLYPAQGQVAIPINDVLQGTALLRLDNDVGVNEITRRQPLQSPSKTSHTLRYIPALKDERSTRDAMVSF